MTATKPVQQNLPNLWMQGDELQRLYALNVAPEVHDLYFALRWFRNKDTGLSFPSRKTLAGLLRITERSISARIKATEKAGLIVCHRARGLATKYSFPLVTGEAGFTGSGSRSSEGDRKEPVKPSDTNQGSPPHPNYPFGNTYPQHPGEEGGSSKDEDQDPARRKAIEAVCKKANGCLTSGQASDLLDEYSESRLLATINTIHDDLTSGKLRYVASWAGLIKHRAPGVLEPKPKEW